MIFQLHLDPNFCALWIRGKLLLLQSSLGLLLLFQADISLSSAFPPGEALPFAPLAPTPIPFSCFSVSFQETKSCWQRCGDAGDSCKHRMIFQSIIPAPQQFPSKAFRCLKPRADICTVTSSEASEQLWLSPVLQKS